MSPSFMAGQAGCAVGCPGCLVKERQARRFRIAGFTLIVLALATIAVAFPVDGLPGAGLTAGATAALWTGWYLVVRRAGRLDAELRQAAATSRAIRGLNR